MSCKTKNLNKWLFQSSGYSPEDIVIKNFHKTINYKTLQNEIANYCNYLTNNGIREGDNIAVLSKNSFEYVILLLAIWELGAVPVLLNIRLSEKEASELTIFAGCRLIISESIIITPSSIPVISFPLPPASAPGNSISTKDFNPDSTALIIFTSGSKGQPKGVMHSYSNLVNSFKNIDEILEFEKSDVFLASLPFYHIGGLMIIIRALASGGLLTIPDSLSAESIADSIDPFCPAYISLVPTILVKIIELNKPPNEKLKMLFLGGGPSTKNNLDLFLNSAWPVAKVYGSTETCSMATFLSPEKFREKPESSGHALPNNHLEISSSGEIMINSNSLFNGYYGNTVLSKASLKDNQYATGDSGFIDQDGLLFIMNRRKDLIISGGENVDPRQIENVINSFAEVIESHVFGEINDKWGQIVCAAVSMKTNDASVVADLDNYLKQNMRSFKKPKKYYLFDQLPKNEMGKVIIKETEKENALIIVEKI